MVRVQLRPGEMVLVQRTLVQIRALEGWARAGSDVDATLSGQPSVVCIRASGSGAQVLLQRVRQRRVVYIRVVGSPISCALRCAWLPV